MKLFALCVVVLVGIAQCMPISDEQVTSEFEKFIHKFHKKYSSPLDLESRFAAFKSNFMMIRKHNSNPDKLFEMALNAFADLTPNEFRIQYLMEPRQPVQHEQSRYAEPLGDDYLINVPPAFDWKAASPAVVSPVRDQGSTGTCWAFSTAQNIEGQWALAGHTLTELSVEQIVDCDAEFDPNNENADCGVFGGWPYLSYHYVLKTGGLESEAQYPYCCGSGDCFPCMAQGYNSSCGPPPSYCNATQNHCSGLNYVASISNWTAYGTDETDLVSQLYNRGPLSVLLNASWLQFYSKGIFAPSSCDPTELDHAVLLTGWGIDSNTDYWNVKNSWGASWGESGYFRIARGKGMCGINTAVTSALV